MPDTKNALISDIIDVLLKTLGEENKKIVLLMPFGVIVGELPDQTEIEETEEKKSYDFLLLKNVEIRPFTGDKYTMPMFTVLLDQILGVSLASSLD